MLRVAGQHKGLTRRRRKFLNLKRSSGIVLRWQCLFFNIFIGRIVGSNLQQLEVSEEKALAREESYQKQIHDLIQR